MVLKEGGAVYVMSGVVGGHNHRSASFLREVVVMKMMEDNLIFHYEKSVCFRFVLQKYEKYCKV